MVAFLIEVVVNDFVMVMGGSGSGGSNGGGGGDYMKRDNRLEGSCEAELMWIV